MRRLVQATSQLPVQRGGGYFFHSLVKALCNIQNTEDISVVIQHRLQSAPPPNIEYHMPKPASDHNLQRLGRRTTLPRTNRILRHNIPNENIPRINPLAHNPKRQILGRENAAEPLVLVNDEHTVLALGSHDLRRFRDACVGVHGERLGGPEGHDCAGGITFLARAVGLHKALFAQFALQLSPDCLQC
jgi:hypothetical protein